MADKDIDQQIAELKKKIEDLKKEKVKAKKAADEKGKRKVGQKSRKLPGNVKIELQDEAKPDFKLIKEIKDSPLYGKSSGRDEIARKYITENAKDQKKHNINPGQLIIFNYFEPKGKEDLEYYDASPCTIFFGVFNSQQGKRVLGFNIHYYPPQMRYKIMDKIFELYRPVYTKYFADGNYREVEAFDYQMLIKQLEKENLGFGVREYIPQLIGNPMLIPANMWEVAVFTEGWFKKKTRTQIMKFWQQWSPTNKPKKPNTTNKK